jgi:hypothetical protein
LAIDLTNPWQSGSVTGHPDRTKLSGFAAYNQKRAHRRAEPQDELETYKNIAGPPEAQDLLNWWRLHQDQYPVRKHLAFTLLAVPASTGTDKRLFSTAGNVVVEQRPHTKQQLAESVQLRTLVERRRSILTTLP